MRTSTLTASCEHPSPFFNSIDLHFSAKSSSYTLSCASVAMRSMEANCLQIVASLWFSYFSTPENSETDRGVDWLQNEMWSRAAESMQAPFIADQFLRLWRTIQDALICFLFPRSLKTHRHQQKLHQLLATVLTLHGVLQLRARCGSAWASKILRVCVDPIRKMCMCPRPTAEIVGAGFFFLRSAIAGQGSPDEAAVYVLFNFDTTYIGKALLERTGSRPGIPARIMEHMSGVLRRSAQTSRTVRAVLFRRSPINSLCFIVAKRGIHEWIKASETVAIRMLRPNGNEGQCSCRSPHDRGKRLRPPPRFRCSNTASIWEAGTSGQQVIKTMTAKARRGTAQQPPAWTGMSFNEAYRRKLRWHFAKTGKHGPLNIYSPRNGGLLALWACAKNSNLHLPALFQGRPRAAAIIRLARLVNWIPGYVKKARGRELMNKLLHRFGLPSNRVAIFKSPSPEVLAAARSAVSLLATKMAHRHGSCMYKWTRDRARFALSGEPKFSDRRNAVQASKNIKLAKVYAAGCFEIEGHRRGMDIKRLPGNWSITDHEALQRCSHSMEKDLRAWCQAMHADKFSTRACVNKFSRAAHRSHKRAVPRVPDAEAAYTLAMTRKMSGVLVQDDKDRRRTWTMPSACLAAILVTLVLLDSTRWEVTGLTNAQLSTLIYGASMFALPAYLRRGSPGRGSYAPYMYPFVKSKCYAAEGGHVCKKPRHSCLRKVVSFFRAPWRRSWRLVGRGIQLLIMSTGPGFSVWRLRDIIPTLQKGLQVLRAPGNLRCCTCCGANKQPTTMLIADAAQMYEQINTDLVISAFDARAARLQASTGLTTLTVRKTKFVSGWPGGNPHTRSSKQVCFSIAQLRRLLTTACLLKYTCLGDIVVKARGLLIGGMLSMVAAVCLISQEEYEFLNGKNRLQRFIPQGWTPEQAVLGLRYVDDLLLLSQCLCHACLSKLITEIYTVSFEVAPCQLQHTWTDIVLRVDGQSGQISWIPKNPNREWILGTSEKAKERYAPFLGRLQVRFGFLRCALLGRAARLRELEIPEFCQVSAMLEELQELILEGYPPLLLRALVHSLPLESSVVLALRKAVRSLCRELRGS